MIPRVAGVFGTKVAQAIVVVGNVGIVVTVTSTISSAPLCCTHIPLVLSKTQVDTVDPVLRPLLVLT